MASYKQDRQFTDKMHTKALGLVYPKMGYSITSANNNELKELKDKKEGIDYVATDINGNTIYIQERFRRYSENSFTLRYKREYSQFEVELFRLSSYRGDALNP